MSPVMAAYGAGVDSTAMIIEWLAQGHQLDMVLTADTGAEKPATYAYLEMFREWLDDRGIPSHVVRYEPQNFKHYPPYRSLDENCFTNGTLPSISFGFSSCSQKWKVAPQNKWTEAWAPARMAWANDEKVTKLIGYDAGPKDAKRYAHAEGYLDPRYEYLYPLRDWNWDREACEARIRREGLPVPLKSACYMCGAAKPHELHDYPPHLLRRIVLMEARAAPRLTKIDGLWRKPVKGRNGATPRPGSMTEYIRSQQLLPGDEIDHIIAVAPAALVAFQDQYAETPIAERPELGDWVKMFDMRERFNGDSHPLYKDVA